PTRRLRRRIDELFSDASQALATYIRAQMVACVIVGAIAGTGFKVLGSPYPLALGVMAGIFEFIPFGGFVLSRLICVLSSAAVCGISQSIGKNRSLGPNFSARAVGDARLCDLSQVDRA